MLREDLRDPELSGNKARKLHYNLIEAHRRGIRTLVSMGGPYSNHLHALALAGRRLGFATVGVVRGLLTGPPLSPTLADCVAAGMSLHPMNRMAFRALRADPGPFLATFGEPVYWLPEGGSNALAVRGVAECLNNDAVRDFAPEVVLTAAGTGATMAGLAAGLARNRRYGEIWAVAVLKGGGFLLSDAKRLLASTGISTRAPLRVLTGFHFGGYGRRPDALQQFCPQFFALTSVPVEPVYTGRVCYALRKLAAHGAFRQGSRVLLVHTGGLQGAR